MTKETRIADAARALAIKAETFNAARMALPDYVDHNEGAIAALVIDRALGIGYTISVYDGEEWVLVKSSDPVAIAGAMASTSDDRLMFRNEDGEKVGALWLVWGNGTEIVTDYSDSTAMDELLAQPMALAEELDELERKGLEDASAAIAKAT